MDPKVNSNLVVGSRCSNIFFCLLSLARVCGRIVFVYQFTWHGNLIHQSGCGIRYLIRYLFLFTLPLLQGNRKEAEKKQKRDFTIQTGYYTQGNSLVYCNVSFLIYCSLDKFAYLLIDSSIHGIPFWPPLVYRLTYIFLPVLFREHAHRTLKDLHDCLQVVHNNTATQHMYMMLLYFRGPPITFANVPSSCRLKKFFSAKGETSVPMWWRKKKIYIIRCRAMSGLVVRKLILYGKTWA